MVSWNPVLLDELPGYAYMADVSSEGARRAPEMPSGDLRGEFSYLTEKVFPRPECYPTGQGISHLAAEANTHLLALCNARHGCR